jgi:hypothetical protein
MAAAGTAIVPGRNPAPPSPAWARLLAGPPRADGPEVSTLRRVHGGRDTSRAPILGRRGRAASDADDPVHEEPGHRRRAPGGGRGRRRAVQRGRSQEAFPILILPTEGAAVRSSSTRATPVPRSSRAEGRAGSPPPAWLTASVVDGTPSERGAWWIARRRRRSAASPWACSSLEPGGGRGRRRAGGPRLNPPSCGRSRGSRRSPPCRARRRPPASPGRHRPARSRRACPPTRARAPPPA